MRTILVTGVGGPAGRAGATYFAEKGYRVVGADMRPVESPGAAFRLVPPARDPSFPAALLEVAAGERVGLVVPTVSEELPLVARLRPALRGRGIAACVSPPPGIDVAGDKLRTAWELRRQGVAVPSTLDGATTRDALARALGFPLLSKPRFGRGGRGVQVYRGPDDLGPLPQEEMVWQEFLSGDEFDLNLFLEPDGRAAAAVVLRKTGLREGIVGNALSVERVERPDLAELGVRAARALGLQGPLDVDIRLGSDGGAAVLEVNARLGANVLWAREVLDALEDAWRNGRCA